MGQRHQIYVKIKGYEGDTRILGFHHQWLFGKSAVNNLFRVLKFFDNSDKSLFNKSYDNHETSEALQSIMQADVETGYFHNVYPFQFHKDIKRNEPEVIENPLKGDNNNGITIIDLSDEKPKYCFMNIHHLECLVDDDAEKIANSLELKPIDVKTWIKLHYSLESDSLSYKNWSKKDIKENIAYCKKLIDKAVGYKVLTLQEVKGIFPAMFKGK